MGKETINLPLYGVHHYYHPIVEGAFLAKNGQMLHGFFMIDTGSSENILNKDVERLLGSDTFIDDTQRIGALECKGETCPIVNVCVELDGNRSNERFCISQNIVFSDYYGKNRIIGILGSIFMIKHQLVLNLNEECLRTAIIESISLEDKSFFFPMEYGMHHYRIPVVGIVNGKEEYVCVADTGSTLNLIAERALTGFGNYEKLEGDGIVAGVYGKKEISYAEVSFSLFSIGEQTGETRLVTKEDVFQVLPNRDCIHNPEDGEHPPIYGLIGARFMLEQKWILDFGNLAIYAN